MTNHLGVWDYIVVGGTLIFSVLIGVYYAVFSKQTNEDFLMGSRELNVFAVAASMLVTFLSAITILGFPSEVYVYGLQIFMMSLLSIVFVPLSIYFFASVFYKMKLTSVYEYLEKRFDSMIIRRLMAITYIVQYSIITGIVLYAPSIALEQIFSKQSKKLNLKLQVGVGVCGTIYTSIGGYKAVIFTDVFQFFMILIGMFGIIIKGAINAGGILETFRIAGKHGRLNLIDWTVDPFMRHNTLNFVIGSGFTTFVFYGTAQAHVQRYCSLSTFTRAVKAMFLSVILNILTYLIVVLCGISVFATFVGCDPLKLEHIEKADQIVPHFVVTQLAMIPGIMGLFVACIFSAVLSSISSAFNSLSAVTWQDFFSHIPKLKGLNSKQQTNVTRAISFMYGFICIGVAFLAQRMGTMVFQVTMSAVGAFGGPMGGVFIVALFIPVVNKWGAAVGMLTGLGSMMFVAAKSFLLKKTHDEALPTFIDNCPQGTNMTLIKTLSNSTFIPELEWPDKLYTISYINYAFVGAVITIFIAIIVGFLTGGYSDAKKIDSKYLHPLINKMGCRMKRVPSETYKRADRLSVLYTASGDHPHMSNPNLASQ